MKSFIASCGDLTSSSSLDAFLLFISGSNTFNLLKLFGFKFSNNLTSGFIKILLSLIWWPPGPYILTLKITWP